MVPKKELQRIIILEHLTEPMLTKLQPFITRESYDEKQVIFNEGSDAETFYMLYTGKVLLEKRISNQVTVSLGAIKPGYSFGWSAILSKEPFSMVAVSAEPSDVFTVPGKTILQLLANDHSMGFIIMQSINRMIKNRLDRMEEQFLRAIREHPDFLPLL